MGWFSKKPQTPVQEIPTDPEVEKVLMKVTGEMKIHSMQMDIARYIRTHDVSPEQASIALSHILGGLGGAVLAPAGVEDTDPAYRDFVTAVLENVEVNIAAGLASFKQHSDAKSAQEAA
jgi:hypothetical protein